MTLKLGSVTVNGLALNSAPVGKLMLGGVQVWPGVAAPAQRLWTPADLPGTDWEWYDYSIAGSIGLNGSNISSINSQRNGGVPLGMDINVFQPAYQGPQGGLPGCMVTVLDGVRGLQSNPILTGTVSPYAVVNYEITNAAFPTVAGQTHLLSVVNQFSGVTSGDVGFTPNTFFSNWGDPRNAWQIASKRQNGVFNPLGTPSVPTVTVPWRNIWGLPSDPGTVGPLHNPRRMFICGETGPSGGHEGGGSVNVGARLYEQIIWKTAHPSMADIQRVEGYMAWKPGNEALGLVALLPADHPYKNTPPLK